MKNIYKTSLFTTFIVLLTVSTMIFVQINGQNTLVEKCSYLDPLVIDVLAFIAALFLIVEGIFKIMQNKNITWQRQATRSFRIAFGCSILALHIIQVIYK